MQTCSARWLAGAAASLLLFAACGGDDETDGNGGTGDPEPASGSGEVAVEAFDFGFDPGEFSLEPGAKATLELSNRGQAPHTWTADDLGVDVRLAVGSNTTVDVTVPDEDASVGYRCKIHPQMTGTITIGEGDSATSKKDGGGPNDDPGYDY
jgi:plastocyanin